MIIARIRGGLGNQLFQYAAARALAWQNGLPLKLDLYTYKKGKTKLFELDQFKIDALVASSEEVQRFTGSNFISRYLNKQENYLRCPKVLAQPHYHFYEDFFLVPVPVYLSGYWQSEKYFAVFEQQLRKQFVLKEELSESSGKWKELIERENSVALHVRRGDYSANASYNTFFGTLPLSYYEEAVRNLRAKLGSPRFFVFSDDIAWAKSNLTFLNDASFVSHPTRIRAAEDLVLMSICRHQVIANSTFSWWGAWLNSNSEKIVIAPSKWFQTIYSTNKLPTYAARYYNTKDLLPDNWIKL